MYLITALNPQQNFRYLPLILQFSMKFKSLFFSLIFFFFHFQVLIIKSRLRYFTDVTNTTNSDVTGLMS